MAGDLDVKVKGVQVLNVNVNKRLEIRQIEKCIYYRNWGPVLKGG